MDPIDLDSIDPRIHAGPFHHAQREAGASFYEDLGHLWTRAFGDVDDEYWAIRRHVAVWDISSLIVFHFTGSDALAALDRLTTRRISGAEPGVVRYCMVLDQHGMLLDEGTVVVLSPTEAYFLGNDEGATFTEHLERHTHDVEVRISNATRRIPNIAVQGPDSYALLAKLTDADLSMVRWFQAIPEPVRIAGVPGIVTRTGFTGELGYEFHLLDEGAGAEQVWDAIVDAGARPIGLDAIEKVRIEAGLVIAEEDYWAGVTDPYDLSMDRFIELDTHDFVGREACLTTAAAPPRRFVTLTLAGTAPAPGAAVTTSGVSVGVVRSADVTPRYGALALAVLETPFAIEGDVLEVEGQRATVRRVPIDDPAKERPRSDPLRPTRIR